MRKLILFMYFSTIILLLFMNGLGILNTIELYVKYGGSYEVTTIINEVTTVKTVYLINNLFAVIFLFWITFLLIYLIWKNKNVNME